MRKLLLGLVLSGSILAGTVGPALAVPPQGAPVNGAPPCANEIVVNVLGAPANAPNAAADGALHSAGCA